MARRGLQHQFLTDLPPQGNLFIMNDTNGVRFAAESAGLGNTASDEGRQRGRAKSQGSSGGWGTRGKNGLPGLGQATRDGSRSCQRRVSPDEAFQDPLKPGKAAGTGALGAPHPRLTGKAKVALGEFPGTDREGKQILMLFQSFRQRGSVGYNEIPFPQTGLGKKTAGRTAKNLYVEDFPIQYNLRRLKQHLFVHVPPRQAHITFNAFSGSKKQARSGRGPVRNSDETGEVAEGPLDKKNEGPTTGSSFTVTNGTRLAFQGESGQGRLNDRTGTGHLTRVTT